MTRCFVGILIKRVLLTLGCLGVGMGCVKPAESLSHGAGMRIKISQWNSSALEPPANLAFEELDALHPDAPNAGRRPVYAMECDFPGGLMLRRICTSVVIATDWTVIPEPPAVTKNPDIGESDALLRLTIDALPPLPNRPYASHSAPVRRSGSSGPEVAPDIFPGISYSAEFPTQLLPLRFRIYRDGSLISRGEIRLDPPDGMTHAHN